MTYFNFDRLDDLKDGDILFFDELLNGNPVVLNACLTILEQRTMISGKPLPNIMIVAAANEQGMVPLTPQIKERFVWYDVKFDKDMWIHDYMIPKFDITTSIGNKLSDLIINETFTGRNFYTPRSIKKAVSMIIKEIKSPYGNTIIPILGELVQNTFSEPIEIGSKIIQPNEFIEWLNIARLKYENEKIKNKK